MALVLSPGRSLFGQRDDAFRWVRSKLKSGLRDYERGFV